jgi:hypothetical protein
MANPIGLLRKILLLTSKRKNNLIAREEKCPEHINQTHACRAAKTPPPIAAFYIGKGSCPRFAGLKAF